MIEVLQTSGKAISNECSVQIVPFKYRLNDLSPIHRLSEELLVDIFTTFIAEAFLVANKTSRKITTCPQDVLMQVCHHWRCLVPSTPACWTTVHDGAGNFTQSIKNSKESLIDIYLEDKTFKTALEGRDEELYNLLKPESYRWKSMTIHPVENNLDKIAEVIRCPAPQLRELIILRESASTLLVVDLTATTSLRRLTLHCARVDWTNWQLTALKSLELDNVWISRCGKLDDVLRASPGIEQLILAVISCAESDPDMPLLAPIHLPQLSELIVTQVPPQLLSWAAATIRPTNKLRQLQTMHIEPRQLTQSLNQFFNHAIAPLESMTIVDDQTSSPRITIFWGRGDGWISFEGRLDGSQLGRLVASLSGASTEVRLKMEESKNKEWRVEQRRLVKEPTWMYLPNLTKISTRSPETAEEVLEFFSDPKNCPRLSDIDFSQAYGLSDHPVDAFRQSLAKNGRSLKQFILPSVTYAP